MKRFAIVVSVVVAMIIGILCATACTTVEYQLKYKNANAFKLYKTETTVGTEISKTNNNFEKVESLINQLLTSSVSERVLNNIDLDTKIEQDLSGNSDNYSTTLLRENYAISIDYTELQEQIVYYQGDSKVLQHYGYMIILGKTKGYTQVKIYYRTNSSTTSYQNNPMIVYGNTTKLINYIENYK